MRTLTNEHKLEWDKCIPAALFALRSASNESTGFSPNELVYGRNIRSPLDIIKYIWTSEDAHPTVVEHVITILNRFDKSRKVAVETNKKAKIKAKQRYDKDAVHKEYKTGEEVMILKPNRKNKMELYWEGPFIITEKVNEVNYKIQKKNGPKQPTVYHANLMKPYFKREETSNHAVDINEEDEQETELKIWPGSISDTTIDPEDVLNMAENVGDLSEKQREELKAVFAKVPVVFSLKPGLTDLIQFDIELTGDLEPMSTLPRNSPSQKKLIDEQIDKLLEWKVIESDDFFASPMLIVQKSGKQPRPVADYRLLNKVTKVMRQPIPLIEEMVEKVAAAEVISVYDFIRGYFQIKATERAQRLPAIVTHKGIYRLK